MIGKIWRGYWYRSRRLVKAKRDAKKIESLLLSAGMRRHVGLMKPPNLTIDLMLQVFHNNQLGGSFVGRDGEEYYWGMADVAERSRLLDTLNALRKKRRRAFKRGLRTDGFAKEWLDPVKGQCQSAACQPLLPPCEHSAHRVCTACLTGALSTLAPLRYRLFTPELQWQPRGQRRILQGWVQFDPVKARLGEPVFSGVLNRAAATNDTATGE